MFLVIFDFYVYKSIVAAGWMWISFCITKSKEEMEKRCIFSWLTKNWHVPNKSGH